MGQAVTFALSHYQAHIYHVALVDIISTMTHWKLYMTNKQSFAMFCFILTHDHNNDIRMEDVCVLCKEIQEPDCGGTDGMCSVTSTAMYSRPGMYITTT